jgi:hypothetical protein
VSRPLAFAAAALSAALLAAPAARAQSAADVAAARELFKEGSRLGNEGRWDEARDRYERSLQLKRAAITLYSLGVAQHRTGRLVDALESLRAFLAEPPAPATEPWQGPAKELVAELEKRVASIELAITPPGLPGLSVTIDGKAIPAAALDRRRLVDPGAHQILVSATGHREARAQITLAEGSSQRVALTLVPAPRVEPPLPPKTPLGPLRREEAPPEAPSRALPFALLGGGAAALGAGIAVGWVGVGEAKSAPTRDGPEASRARAKMLAGDIVAGAGIAAAGAGLVVLVVQAVSGKAPKPGSVSLSVWTSGPGVGLAGRF